jgi:hypothetical protein
MFRRGIYSIGSGRMKVANGKTTNLTAPYLTWSAFERFLRTLAVLPSHIDATLMSNMSGTAQSQLRTALRFLGFVKGDDQQVTPRLRELHQGMESKDWPRRLAAAVISEYGEIVDGVDLKAGTQGQLEQAFRERGGVSGSALAKAIRFYLTALTKAGYAYSPHFPSVRGAGGSKVKVGTTTRRSNGRRRGKGRKPSGNSSNSASPPAETREITFPVPGGREVRIWWPSGLTPEEESFVQTMLDGYLKLERGGSAG